MVMADPALAALVRMHEAQSAGSSLDEPHEVALQEIERRSKGFSIVAAAARDERLKVALSETLQSETVVGRSAYAARTSVLSLVQAVLWAIGGAPHDHQDTVEGEKLRASVFMTVLQMLHSTNAASVAPRIVHVLLQELHSLQVDALASCVNELIRGVRASQRSQHRGDTWAVFYTIELLPQLLLRVCASMTRSFAVSEADSQVENLSGSDYRKQVLEKLAELSWPRRFFLLVLKNFRDFSLTQDEERVFCVKIYREARKELDSAADKARTLEIFPSVCLSVLQLVGRTKNMLCRRLLTRLLINKCQQLTTAISECGDTVTYSDASGPSRLGERELRTLQSTVLYHVDMAMRQLDMLGNALVAEYEQWFPQRLTTFDIALLLLVASHSKFEVRVVQHLLRYVVATYNSPRSDLSDGHEETLSRKAFINVVQHGQEGSWVPIVKQMTVLGFQLIEFRGLKCNSNRRSRSENYVSMDDLPPWVDFGVRIVLVCFQFNVAVREQVLDRIVNMIIVQNADCQTYVHVISRIVTRHLAELGGPLEARIRECLEYVTHMNPDHANGLLHALSPLLKTQHSLKNFVVLMLRKAMFRKDEGSRIIAIRGFALLLCLSSRIFSRSRTLSQLYSQNITMMSQGAGGSSLAHASVDVDIASQEQSHAMVAEDLYRQFSGIFRRALQLQTKVRLVLYAELIKVFTECPALQQSILKLLFQHYQKYYEFNESVQPPLKLDLCLSRKRGVYEEPLQYLLHTMLHCFLLMKQEIDTDGEDTMLDDIPVTQADGRDPVLKLVERNAEVLFERLKRCDISDFEFDKNSSFSADTALGETNQRLARLVMGIAEVALTWSAMQTDPRGGENDTAFSVKSHTWELMLRYSQIYTWVQRRLVGSDASLLEVKTTKKRKLIKSSSKMEACNSGQNTTESTKIQDGDLETAFEHSASLNWAMLLTPQAIIRILEFATTKMRRDEGGLKTDEEEFVLFIGGKSIQVLNLIQRKLADGTQSVTKRQRFRRTSDSAQAFDHHQFTRRMGDVFIKLLERYCNGDGSLILAKGVGARKRALSENHQPQERMRDIVRISVHGFAWIAEMWSCQPLEEFEEQLVRALCFSSVDADSPDYDLDGDECDGLVRALTPLQKLVEELLSQEMPEEANRILDVVQIVWTKTSANSTAAVDKLIPHVDWVKNLLVARSDQASPRLLEKLTALLLRPHPLSAFRSDVAQQLAQGLQQFCNNAGNEDDNRSDSSPPVVQFRRLGDKQILTVGNAILARIDGALAESERRMKIYNTDRRRYAVNLNEEDFSTLQQLEDETGSQVFRSDGEGNRGNNFTVFKLLCKQSNEVAKALRPFVAMNLNSATAAIRVVRLIGRLYKLLVQLVRDKVQRKDTTLPKFLRQLFDCTAGDLSPAVLDFIAIVHESGTSSVQQKKDTPKSTTGQSKIIPDVIFQLEQYDLVMIRLSKKCKGHDFNAWCKLRPSRDFRLNKEQVKRTLGDSNLKKGEERNEARTAGDNDEVGGGNETSEDTVTELASTANFDEEDDDAHSINDDTESADEELVEVATQLGSDHRRKKCRQNLLAVDSDDEEREDRGDEEEEQDLGAQENEDEEED